MIQSTENPKPHAAGAEPDDDRILTFSEFLGITGLSPATAGRLNRTGDGPPRVQLSPRRVGYPLAGVRAWLAARARA